jgi:phenylpyruvate tautomerase PptA (4-oxalocrotonate tautomerase family)
MLGKNQQEQASMVIGMFCFEKGRCLGLRISWVWKATFSSSIFGLKNGARKESKKAFKRWLKGLVTWFTEVYVNITGLYPESVFVVIRYFVEANVVEEEKRPNC